MTTTIERVFRDRQKRAMALVLRDTNAPAGAGGVADEPYRVVLWTPASGTVSVDGRFHNLAAAAQKARSLAEAGARAEASL